ncbi:MAG: DUF58 domain-containing protein [Pirellulaceae bacterium]|nr:DUF58 domain-containing protein [Pirellulaceae bacterium]
MVLLALAPSIATLLLLAWEPGLLVVIGLDVACLGVVLVDLHTLPRQRHFSVERRMGRVSSLRKRHPVTLIVNNLASRPLTIAVRDGAAVKLHPKPGQFDLTLPGESKATLDYDIRAERRGAFTLDAVHIRATSRWGFWQRLLAVPCEARLAVYPDMRQLGQYAMLARTDRLNLLGVRRARRVGQDHDFERLRDYSIDDNYKHLDWRATARRRKLTVKDFQTSQSQRIIFLVDCGRMMTNEAAGLSLLDHGLNSLLMLSYVALRQGDSVGLIGFSDQIHTFVPPRSGMNQMNRLLHASFDRFPKLVESRYDLAFRYLASHCRKRSLVVLVTNIIDEVNANQVERYLANLVGRHLPLGVLLRDRRMFEAVDMPELVEAAATPSDSATAPPTDERSWRAAAAAEILHWRHQVLADLRNKGVLILDVFPEKMTAPLINQYLEVKARHLL